MKQEWIEILTEEATMENFLRVVLPKVLPEGYTLDKNCFIRPHEGKSHLKKSIPRKVRSYPHFPLPVKLIIIHDQDSNDCKVLKQELIGLTGNKKQIPHLVRIACRELENWYIGDLKALEKVYPDLKANKLSQLSKFREPDKTFGAYELTQLSKQFSKSHASREIPKHMNIEDNQSASFNHFISGLSRFLSA